MTMELSLPPITYNLTMRLGISGRYLVLRVGDHRGFQEVQVSVPSLLKEVFPDASVHSLECLEELKSCVDAAYRQLRAAVSNEAVSGAHLD
jgi:hypothetical protein